MKLTKDEEDKIIVEIQNRMKIAIDGWSTNHRLGLEDVKFRHGDQWSEKDRKDREADGRPTLTFNRMEAFVDQVVGDQRQARPAISVTPIDLNLGDDGKEEKIPNLQLSTKQLKSLPDEPPLKEAGDDDYDYSQVMEGLIRNIEYQSKAANAYDTAFDCAVGNGFGYWRVITEYENDGFDQCIKIKRISNPFRVLLDPSAQETCKEDAMWGFLFTWMSKEAYEREYKDYPIATMEAILGTNRENWFDGDNVRLGEYFRRVPVKNTIVLLETGQVMNLGNTEETIKAGRAKIKSMGGKIVKERKSSSYKTEWMKTNGAHILSEVKEVPTSYIPIIPVFGKELNIEGEIIYRSLFRHAKDAQRSYNYWRTAMTEQIALAPKAPYIGPASAFAGYEDIWKNANIKNFSFLPFNDKAQLPPQRAIGPQMPQGALAEAQAADMDMKSTIGIFGAGLGEPSNEKSGRAILARQKEGDVGTYAFHDNLAKSIEHTGRILVEMIPRIYDTERVVRIRQVDGSEDSVKINIQDKNGRKLYDLGSARYDVAVKVGPSYTTQRLEAADSLMEMTRNNPNLWSAVGDLIASNMDWPGADEMAKRLKRMIPPELLKDEDDETQPPPSPEQLQAMVMDAAAQMVQQDKETQRQQNEAQALQIKQFEADTKRMEAEVKSLKEVSQGGMMDEEKIKDLIAQAFAEVVSQGGIQQ